MKRILFTMLMMAIAGGFSFADDMDFAGEWIVGNDDVKGSGITVNFNDSGTPGGFTEVRSSGIDLIVDRNKPVKYDDTFLIITVGTMFDFAVNGSKLTGSIIRNESENPIFDGKFSRNKITFTVRETIKEKTYSYYYIGELSDDGIKFEVTPQRSGGNRFSFMVRRLVQ